MWSATIRYLSISSSESELYWDISVFNLEKDKSTKKKGKKREKIANLEVKPFNDSQLPYAQTSNFHKT